MFETFGSKSPSPVQFRFEALMVPPMPRFWFESEDGVHLLQLQQDRFVHNWRKRNDNVYPRYEPIRARFLSEIGVIVEFLAREGLGPLQPNQCEVTYTNIVVFPNSGNPHTALEHITPLWAGWQYDAELAPIENANLSFRYLMRSDDIPVGRVYVAFEPVLLTADASPAIKIEITARGKPHDSGIESAFRLLDAERRVVVRTFVRVTTEEMHTAWERNDGK
jgi:uncharacterized protein (TIGR04255 family)